MQCKDRLEQYLRDNQVPFQVQHHPRAYTAQDVAASEHISGKLVAKPVMLVCQGKLVMAVLCGPHHIDLAKAGLVLGENEIRLAYEREFASTFPDCELGAIHPFGNLYNLPVYVDEALSQDETIVFRAGSHTDTISLRYEDFARLVQPKVASLAYRA